jgi:hypothetical protein
MCNTDLNLRSITIPSSVTTANTYDFATNYSLRHFKIYGGLTEIPDSFLRGCMSLETMELASGITTIGDSSFRECKKLITITLPSTVTRIK